MKVQGPKMISWSCGCCKRCRLVVEGPLAGKCYYGGPFSGYYNTETNLLKTLEELERDRALILQQKNEVVFPPS